MNVLDEIPLDSREHLDRVGEQVLLLDEYVQLEPADRIQECCHALAGTRRRLDQPTNLLVLAKEVRHVLRRASRHLTIEPQLLVPLMRLEHRDESRHRFPHRIGVSGAHRVSQPSAGTKDGEVILVKFPKRIEPLAAAMLTHVRRLRSDGRPRSSVQNSRGSLQEGAQRQGRWIGSEGAKAASR
jgi:hypothetical protein